MKKSLIALAAVLFLAVSFSPVLADTTPVKTPAAKSMKHKKTHKKGKKAMKPASTPMAK